MKIDFIIANMDKGGGQRVIAVLSKALCDKGYDVKIVLTEKAGDIAFQIDDRIEVVQLQNWFADNCSDIWIKTKNRIKKGIEKVSGRHHEYYEKKRYYGTIASKLSAYLKKNPADVVIGKLCGANIILGLSSLPKSVKKIMYEGTFPLRSDYSEEFIRLRNECYEKADICVFQTRTQQSFFSDAVQQKSVVILNPLKEGLPVHDFGQPREKEIVTFGGLRAVKNFRLLVDTFYRIWVEYPEYRLSIYGSGELKSELQQQIQQYGMEKNARIYDFDANVHEKIVNSSVFVLSSDFEGLPNSLSEAMAVGIPVISTDCQGGGARQLIDDRVNGMIVPPRDTESLYQAIKYYIDNPSIAEEYAGKALEIRETCSVEFIARQWIDLCTR